MSWISQKNGTGKEISKGHYMHRNGIYTSEGWSLCLLFMNLKLSKIKKKNCSKDYRGKSLL